MNLLESLNSKRITIMLMLFAFSIPVSLGAGSVFGVLALLCVLLTYKRHNFKIEDEYKGYFYVLGIFIVTMLISAIFSPDVMRGLKRLGDFYIWRFTPFAVACFLVQDVAAAKKILAASFAGISVSAAYTLWQGINGMSRAQGFFNHPMTYAGLACVCLPLLLIEFFERRITGKYYWVSGIMFVLGSAALIVNMTRGAWIALAITCAIVLLYYMLQSKRNFIVGITFVCILAGALVNNTAFMRRAATITDLHKFQSNTERILIWKSAWNAFNDHKLTGVGLGQYAKAYQTKYRLPESKEVQNHAHNNFIQMLAETGLIGFLGFTLMFGYILMQNIVLWIKNKNPYAMMAVASTLALLLQGLTEYNVGNSSVMKIYWLLLGVLVFLGSKDKSKI